jgi:hypothetical protein
MLPSASSSISVRLPNAHPREPEYVPAGADERGHEPWPASSVTTSGFGPGFGIAALGQKVHNNWIVLDGAPLRTAIHGAVRMRPSVEALEEFKVEAGFYSAEFGTESGAQVISAIRPGSNQFHGTLFEFLRNNKLDARNFFENPLQPRQPLRRNNFGTVVSGRIIRDKALFFTANYEGYIERISSQAFAVYPTDRMKQGDLTEPFFRSGLSPAGALTPVLDPLSAQPFCGQPDPAQSHRGPVAQAHAVLSRAEFRPVPVQWL